MVNYCYIPPSTLTSVGELPTWSGSYSLKYLSISDCL